MTPLIAPSSADASALARVSASARWLVTDIGRAAEASTAAKEEA